jgi:virginiamycin B lyase
MTVLLLATARTAASQTITEFPIPSAAASIVAGPDGVLWFAGKIGRITTTGVFSEFPLPTPSGGPFGITGCPVRITAGPVGITAGPMGITGCPVGITAGPMGITGCPVGITAGPDGALWFAEQGVNKIGRITTTGEFNEFPLQTPNGGPFAPYGITVGSDGALWFTEFKGNKIGRIGQIDEDVTADPQTFPWERWILYLSIVASSGMIIARRLKHLHLQ